MRKLLIKILFRLLNYPKDFESARVEKIDKWLSFQFGDIGFREYYKMRTIQILKTMGSGLNQENYHIYMGQRFELLKLLENISKAKKRSKKHQEQIIKNKSKGRNIIKKKGDKQNG